jgi:hypothetical protein
MLKKELAGIHKEIQDIANILKSLPKGSDVKALEKRLANIIDRLPYKEGDTQICRVTVDLDKLTQKNEILEKLRALKKKISGDVDVNRILIVKKIGEIGRCNDCGFTPCKCYVYLTKPLVKSVDGKYEIRFEKDWGELDIENYLRSMKYLVDKKK